MKSYSRSQLTDGALIAALDTRLSLDLDNAADLLADLAEIDARKLYVPAAYGSMFDFCVRAKRMSEDVAGKRIHAARTAREFPAIFPMLADGRLTLTAVLMLATHLKPLTADGLLSAAANKTNAQIEKLLAEHSPKPDLATSVWELAPAAEATAGPDAPTFEHAARPVVPSTTPNVAVQMGPLSTRRKPFSLSAGKYGVEFTMDEEMHADLLAVQTLLGHVLPSGDVAEVFRRSLRELRRQLEKRKFAKCDRPRPQTGAAKGRHVPAAVKRAVRERDDDQCTFVSDKGRRCESRTRLELDHIEPVARGGESTTGNLRLRCRVHNNYEAECTFSAEFMRGKRAAARELAAQRKAATAEAEARAKERAEAQAIADAESKARAEFAREQDVIPWLRELGYNLARAQKGAAACAHIPDAPLEDRMKAALRALAPHCMKISAPSASSPS